VPAIADECGHVTILQRSPTYFYSGPNRNETADMLRELGIPEEWIHEIARRKILHDQQAITQLSFENPDFLAGELINSVRAQLPEGFDVERHFTPHYRPWRQRLAYLPDGDLFKGISSGKASVVTDEIETFTQRGIRLASGDELTADIVVTATGFNLSVLGDINFSVDGAPVDFAKTVTYRGMMFTGVPNMVWVFGYFRASWTLRVDLVADFVCRLLGHMDDLDASSVVARLRDDGQDEGMPILEWIDPDNFNPGYLVRSVHLMPRRGDKPEWQHSQDYWSEKDLLATVDLDDGCLLYD
jgi:cation diffusion facilitator CzcD-associated flavoprotein CzcO